MNKTYYLCYPARNKDCSKELCFERGGPCGMTSDVRAALRDLTGQPIKIIEEERDGKDDRH